ncbi:MAG: transaldolase [Yaniella sp.]|uniref:transaldolase n=1 Tax=Yaniella sp. TaxID=2773929 RepID=UPI002651D071|nr:transaldolase [Yaniella sp.]MDN6149377.1 transaldolase [Yaniella sp.]MDN6173243.1 transaldolase [Yaniella sp.]
MFVTQNQNTKALHDAGVSLWLDDLSRDRIDSGDLQNLIDTKTITGVTTNPAIFGKALTTGDAYTHQLSKLAASGADAQSAVVEMTTDDVRAACDILAPIYRASNGYDGRVSIEVDPRLAKDTDRSVAQAIELANTVDRENVMIKIPGTVEGLPAISKVLTEGISVNVTLIFSLTRYREVVNAWLTGLEGARTNGHDLSKIHSVASFFVSRVDSEIDAQLEALDIPAQDVMQLRGRAGIGNARLAYRVFEQMQDTERWRLLESAGARLQRPLWASTGTKNPEYSDVRYVNGLVGDYTVNTLPEDTLDAVADHGEITESRIPDNYAMDDDHLDDLARAGIDYHQVVAKLEDEGLEKFVDAWNQLLGKIQQQLDAQA